MFNSFKQGSYWTRALTDMKPTKVHDFEYPYLDISGISLNENILPALFSHFPTKTALHIIFQNILIFFNCL